MDKEFIRPHQDPLYSSVETPQKADSLQIQKDINLKLTQDLSLKEEALQTLKKDTQKKGLHSSFELKQKFEKSIQKLDSVLKENRELQRNNLQMSLTLQKHTEELQNLSQKNRSYEDIETLFKNQIHAFKERNESLTKALEEKKKQLKDFRLISEKTYKKLKETEALLGKDQEFYSEKTYHNLKKQNDFLKEKSKQLADKLRILQSENQNLEKNNFELHLEQEKTREEFEINQNKINFFSKSKKDLKEELEDFKNKKDALDTELENFKERNLFLESRIKDLQRQEALEDMGNKVSKEDYKKLSEQSLVLRQKFEQTIDKIERVQVDNINLQKENLNKTSEFEKTNEMYEKTKRNFNIFSQRESILKDKIILLGQKLNLLMNSDETNKGKIQNLEEIQKKNLYDVEKLQDTLVNKQKHIDTLTHRLKAYAKYHRQIRPLARRLKIRDKTHNDVFEKYEALKDRYEKDIHLVEEAKLLKGDLLEEKNKAIYFERRLESLRETHDELTTQLEKEREISSLRLHKSNLENQDFRKQSQKSQEALEAHHSLKEQLENMRLLWKQTQKQLDKQNVQNQSLQKLNQNLSYSFNQYREKITTLKTELENIKNQEHNNQKNETSVKEQFDNMNLLWKNTQRLLDKQRVKTRELQERNQTLEQKVRKKIHESSLQNSQEETSQN